MTTKEIVVKSVLNHYLVLWYSVKDKKVIKLKTDERSIKGIDIDKEVKGYYFYNKETIILPNGTEIEGEKSNISEMHLFDDKDLIIEEDCIKFPVIQYERFRKNKVKIVSR